MSKLALAAVIFISFFASVAVVSASVSYLSTPLSVGKIAVGTDSDASVYVIHDAAQQNTCYVVENNVIRTADGISCIADHVQADFPTTTPLHI